MYIKMVSIPIDYLEWWNAEANVNLVVQLKERLEAPYNYILK